MSVKGFYRIYKNGVLVGETENLITLSGKRLILQFLASSVGSYAGAISYGTSTTPAVNTDSKLGFEFGRSAILLRAADPTTGRITFKASLDPEVAGVINELGIWPYLSNSSTEYGGHMVTTFDPNTESLSGGAVNTTTYRIGAESYGASPAASGTSTISLTSIRNDFSGYSDTDIFSLAYFLQDANTASIAVRLKVDNSNYFGYTITTGSTPGYVVTDWTKSQFTATGSPTWDAITSADFLITAKAAGATTVLLDGLRVNDTDIYPDYTLVSRAVLGTPITKSAGEQVDLEYLLEFTIS